MDLRFLADVNATLNATAFVLAVAGLLAIRRGSESAHKRLMLSAAAVSVLFLASYLTYHMSCDPVKFEDALPGILILSSGQGDSRGDQGLCRIHQRLVTPEMTCRHLQPCATGE